MKERLDEITTEINTLSDKGKEALNAGDTRLCLQYIKDTKPLLSESLEIIGENNPALSERVELLIERCDSLIKVYSEA